MKTIILASASPRRKEILEKHRIAFHIEVSDVDESHGAMHPAKLVEELSKRKAKAVFEKFPGEVILGADTVVAYGDEILEKPKNDEDAYRMISMLQGNVHQVYTGVTVCSPEKEITFSVKTDVYVKKMSPEEINTYIATGEGKDKAGSYAIQGIFSKYIEKYDGDYENVVGLPGKHVEETLKDF